MTKIKNKTQTGHSSTVDADIAQLENDVHQALEVIDTDTGNILSYRQLMRDLELKKLEHVLSKQIRTASKWVRRTNEKPN